MNQMTHYQRVRAALKLQETRPRCIALWRHFPNKDKTAEALTYETVTYQKKYDFDFVKLTPMGLYGVVDWGTVLKYFPVEENKPPVEGEFGVKTFDDFARVRPLDVLLGRYGQEVKAVGMVARELGNTADISQTIFSPLTTAKKLAGGELLAAAMRHEPAKLHSALAAITQTTIDFVKECSVAGATSFFLATQCATSDFTTVQGYAEYGRSYDMQVLQAMRALTDFIILHIHGENIFFEEVLDYPVDAINWHDRRTAPTIAEARKLTDKCLIAGVDELGTLVNGKPEEIKAEINEAFEQAGGKGLIIAPGCVIPPSCSEERYRTAISAVRG